MGGGCRGVYWRAMKSKAIIRLGVRGWKWACLALLAIAAARPAWPQGPARSAELVQRFRAEKVFWKQAEIAKDLIALHDKSVLLDLAPWLTHEDRHIRANVAYVFAALGDDRGFDSLTAILHDFSNRPIAQGGPAYNPSVRQQIEDDRYYAVHVFGLLKDARAVGVLVPLLQDKSIGYNVAWALGEIGDKSAISPLIAATYNDNPDERVIAVDALAKLDAKEALPRLRVLLNDSERCHFGRAIPVSEAAAEAIKKLEAAP